ncbi:MAG TPA: hypothetical protein VJ838_06530 [Gaiellaceae bacterium]|nr:hypothetical protein [Gaiellaceae bacterium]
MFEGFPAEQRAFFAAVARDTTWEAVSTRAEQHRRAIYGPMCLLVEELEDEFGPAKVYRLHRSPRYWVEQWAYAPVVDTIAFGVSLSRDGLWVEGGWLRSSADQIARYRRAVNPWLEATVGELRASGFELLGDRIRRAETELLGFRSLVAGRSLGSGSWLATREPVERVLVEWRRLRPLVNWLAEHVGPRNAHR